jgi:hypothetical protein
MQSKKINELGTNLSPSIYDLTVVGDAATGQLKKITLNQIASLFGSVGGVSSVAMTVPTGLTVTGSPITTSGTLAVTLTSGYSIPTTAKQAEWDTANADRFKWDGGASGLTASTGRTSLGATTIGSNFFTLTNPSAVTFLRVNADNTISALDAGAFRTAIGAGTSSTTGTVTSVAALTLGTTGTDITSSVVNGTTTPVITLNIPTASATNRGALSSADWTTFNNKQNTISLTANSAVNTGSTGQLVASITTATELAYLSGVSSNVQTQLDGKAATFTLGSVSSSPTSVMTITGSGGVVNGSLTFTINQSSSTANGYLSSTDWTTFNNKGNRIVGSPNQAVTTNSTSQYVASITTATELSYLSGVSSNVQTQLDGKAASFTLGTVSGSPSGVLSVTGSGGVVNGSLTVTIAQASATTSGYLSSADWNTFNNSATGNYLPLSGGTLSGNLIVNGSTNTPLKITATEPYMEVQANGSTNVCGIKLYPSTNYDAYIGNYTGGKLWLIAGNADNAYVAQDGSLYNRTGTYGTISDITLKENIVDTTPKLQDILKLKVRNFNFIGNEKKQLGFIAQEFEEVFPNAVDTDTSHGEHYGKKVVKTTVLIPMLVKVVQEQNEVITNLTERINNLEKLLNK